MCARRIPAGGGAARPARVREAILFGRRVRRGSSYRVPAVAEPTERPQRHARVRYGTWWSPCGEIINPYTSVIVNGATNTETECISHVALRTNGKVYTQVREFVR
jgi:hypothetical protein